MKKDSQILIIGHNDIVEKTLFSRLITSGFTHIFSTSELALNTTIQASVYQFFSRHKPEYVFLAPTRSGGIAANQNHPAEFLYHNLESQNNIIYAANKFGTKKLLFIASSCIYPKDAPQPLKPEYLLTGPLEKTSEPYSMAKIAGIKMCQAFKKEHGLNSITVIPSTLFGPDADMDLQNAHVMGALIHKFHDAVSSGGSEVVVWGSGKPKRDFLYIDDFIEGCLFVMERYDGDEQIHIGSGHAVSIGELAGIIQKVSGFSGGITFDSSKSDGTMHKELDTARMKELGWTPSISLEEGIRKTYQWYDQKQKVEV